MKRARYIANVWTNATSFDPYELEAEESGWILKEGISEYEFKWFEGPQLPPTVKDVILDGDDCEVEDDVIYNSDDHVDHYNIENEDYETK
ncbi:hypothetical protein PV325_008459 [Microctonus aethiopoides]|nr:hypothetical protein PV325_008459 [Microctonus aethiopoides]KAK0077810.1 hypothetical protein PV326_009820 [Microctonus aethiopoides]